MSLHPTPTLRTRAGRWGTLSVAVAAVVFAGVNVAHASGASPAKKSCSSSNPCLTETNSGSGDGIVSSATSGSGVSGQSTGNNAGVSGSNSSTGSGVYGYSPSGPGLNGQSHAAAGVQGYSAIGNGMIAQQGSNPNNASALLVIGGSTIENLRTFEVRNSNDTDLLVLGDQGDLAIDGEIYTDGSCLNGCVDSRRVRSYGARTSVPTLDDVGEAVLREGNATVRLDPAFANAIDREQSYVVLLTPEGDAGALYVAARNPQGFEVRESGSGHHSIPFAYRIVARPFGAREVRLPMDDVRAR